MKIAFIIFLAIACMAPVSHADEKRPGPDAVVVKVMDEPFPSDKKKQEKFLWHTFANKPDEKKFSSYTTRKWKKTFTTFVASLVKKADEQKLDSASLRKALDLVLDDSKGKIAYLPVGAYQTTLGHKPVWIVILKWENPFMTDKGESVRLGHICGFVFDQKTLKQVGFMTCG